jgi:DNA-binding GntR family transcriptional regulator
VSRTPFREAIKKLSDLKLVEVLPRFGTYVSGVDFNEVKHAYEVRLTLEPLACKLSAERRTTEQVTELEALIEESETLTKNEPPLLSRSKFSGRCHKVIDEAAHNPLLAGELDRLRTVCARVTTSPLREKIPFLEIISQWRRICLAVKNQDRDSAEALMTEYIKGAIDNMRKLFFL